ncbi:MAG: bifunctional folylpolyglutamate synthase/dihydrofolate synthase [Phycisphaeraceae bacterium]|nr:bifunctional folylpolyglutamate synthase/dihydrofolate synthase [Phycisphaerales bacterium]MCB9844310.1 bifunctional folylpolyglutamate synthase/dihydrofolate synthase [Phycisphaeraceae bacterium]
MPKSTPSSSNRSRTRTSKKKPSTRKSATRRKKFENYHAALKYLYERTDVERTRPSRVPEGTFKLDRMRAILEGLENPHESLRFVHVGGTNGKGSTVAMISTCLQECGYAVGTYTSPHLVDIRERIQINDHVISYPAFTELMTRVARAADDAEKKHGQASFFELMTALGFLYFAEQAVDVVIAEVGLGGRLDSTNVITPEVSVVTSISLDHMHFLGKTLPEIATEKAGIFKPGVPALVAKQETAVNEVFRAKSAEVGAPLYMLGDNVDFSNRFEANQQLGPHTRVGIAMGKITFEHVPVPLPGEHQATNCGLALTVLALLRERGFDVPESKIITGLEKTVIPGRMEVLGREPRVLLDGAHNPAALQALVRSIGAHIPYDSMVMIVGCSADKDVDGILEKVALGGDKVIFTRTKGNPRAADAEQLAHRFTELSGKVCQTAASLEEALSIAGRAAGRDDLVVITGSFYLVGEAKKLLSDRAAKLAASAAN